MPTYEYRCENCGEHVEAFQRMSDAALTTCPHCGKDTLKRLILGGAGVLYKGEGWYVTDYSKKSSGGKDSSSSTTSSTSTSGTTSSTSGTSSSKPSTPSTGSEPAKTGS